MITVYYLPVERIDNTDVVRGIEYIHNAILQPTHVPELWKLLMDTSPSEHLVLSLLALEFRDSTQEEIDYYNSLELLHDPDPDTLRVQELLSTSPDVITQPETWELLRIFGKRLHYKFD